MHIFARFCWSYSANEQKHTKETKNFLFSESFAQFSNISGTLTHHGILFQELLEKLLLLTTGIFPWLHPIESQSHEVTSCCGIADLLVCNCKGVIKKIRISLNFFSLFKSSNNDSLGFTSDLDLNPCPRIQTHPKSSLGL